MQCLFIYDILMSSVIRPPLQDSATCALRLPCAVHCGIRRRLACTWQSLITPRLRSCLKTHIRRSLPEGVAASAQCFSYLPMSGLIRPPHAALVGCPRRAAGKRPSKGPLSPLRHSGPRRINVFGRRAGRGQLTFAEHREPADGRRAGNESAGSAINDSRNAFPVREPVNKVSGWNLPH
jgi:hypothetical protein